jgi:hypothetical protein
MKIENATKQVKTLVSIARTVDLKKAAIPFYDILPSWCFPERQLRFKAYCVGMGKTGTTTMHAIFSKQYRSMHEPENRFLTYKILAFINGKIGKSEFAKYVKHRDRRLGLEMDSSYLNLYLLDILVSEFSEAKFILTIRDCYSWLDSVVNHRMANPTLVGRDWFRRHLAEMADIWYKTDKFQHANEEKTLAERGLYTLDGYFSYWREYNSRVLATVPKERLLVVKTTEINQNIQRIENFLGIPQGTLPNQVRENVRSKKINILSQIDKDFLEAKANFYCKELMDKYFPEIKGFNYLK